jgi:two-component system response regulator
MTKATSQQQGKAILLVEDDPQDVILTLRAFQQIQLKHQVAVVSDGAEALDYLFGTGDYAAHPPGLPRIVLLDLHLPKLNGLEVLDRIRTDPRTRHLPVVAFTSSLAERDMTASYLGGANSCVRKPEEFADFAETLRQIWHYWSAINEVPCILEAGAVRAAVA